MKPAHRRRARQYVVQAMYQWQIAGTDLATIETQFREDFDFDKTDTDYFNELLYGIPEQASQLDNKFAQHLDRQFKELGPVEVAILRLGTYELLNRIDIPYKVVINESVELGKRFAATDAHKYINSILDQVSKHCRQVERGA